MLDMLRRARDFQDRPELAQLCTWYRNHRTGVCALIGMGGAGKTALVERFLRLLPGVLPQDRKLPKDPSLATPDGVFVFSFYSQSPETFFPDLAAWLAGEVYDPSIPSLALSYELILRLRLGTHSVLLVLDGFERILDDGADGGVFGQIKDENLRSFILRVAEGHLRDFSIILTTRFRLLDPAAEQSPHYQEINVEGLTPLAAVSLLRARGVRGNKGVLTRLSEEQRFHALTVDLLGGYIARFCNGDPARLPDQPDLTLNQKLRIDPEIYALRDQEQRFVRVTERYREALAETDPATLALLERICLFRRGVERDLLERVFTGTDKQDVAGPDLAALSAVELDGKLGLLADMRLVEVAQPTAGAKVYSVHPAVRAGFLRRLDPEAARKAHRAVRRELLIILGPRRRARSPADAATLDLLEEIVYHASEAGFPAEAWVVYRRRMGGYRNLGLRLGAYERGERICRALVRQPPDHGPLPEDLSEEDQAIFLKEWGLYLENIGRLDAAASLFEKFVTLCRQQGDLPAAAIGSQNLAWIQALSGRLRQASKISDDLLLPTGELSLPKGHPDYPRVRQNVLSLRGAIRNLRGEPGYLNDFQVALEWQREVDGKDHRPLYGSRGLQYALALARIGQNGEAARFTQENLLLLSRLSGTSYTKPRCLLLLADLARMRESLGEARGLLAEARDWALARGAKEPLCWAALIRARIALAESQRAQGITAEFCLREARESIDGGLRIAHECGFALYHIDLLSLGARLNLLTGDAHLAMADACASLFGRVRSEQDAYESPALDESAPAEARGIFPPPDSGFPILLASTHPECSYAWGEAEGHHVLGESLLLQAAQILGSDKFAPSQFREQLSAEVRSILRRGIRQLLACRRLRQRIRDPRLSETLRVLKNLKNGLLTEFPIRPVAPEPGSRRKDEEASPWFEREQIFLSYSRSDQRWLELLRKMLVPLVRNGGLTVWDDTRIKVGNWEEEIKRAIATARVAVLLVSSDFLASEFIFERELPALIEASEREGLQILWIYLSSCLVKETPIYKFQAAHDVRFPLDRKSEAEQKEILTQICQRIKEVMSPGVR